MITDLAGVESIKAAIQNAPNYAWKITETKPNITESGRITTPAIFDASEATNNADAAKRFEDWANLVLSGNPNNNKVYYLTIFEVTTSTPKGGRPKAVDPIYFSFTLTTPYSTHTANSFPAGGHTGGHTGARMGSPVTQEQIDAQIELKRLQWENEQLRKSIIDPITTDEDAEEWDDDEDDDEDDDTPQPLKVFTDFFSGVVNSPPEVQSPMQATVSKLIQGLADKITGEVTDSPELKALKQIKAAAPDADKLLIKLGQIAQSNPEQIKDFVTQILNTFNNEQEQKKP